MPTYCPVSSNLAACEVKERVGPKEYDQWTKSDLLCNDCQDFGKSMGLPGATFYIIMAIMLQRLLETWIPKVVNHSVQYHKNRANHPYNLQLILCITGSIMKSQCVPVRSGSMASFTECSDYICRWSYTKKKIYLNPPQISPNASSFFCEFLPPEPDESIPLPDAVLEPPQISLPNKSNGFC